jgi:CheY-like chemotaxis protein/nitrogen-specific signal transduction histidine kinase
VDITDRKDADERRERMLQTERAARAEAERVGRLKDEFLATISHELRTPLNAILGWSQLLRRRPMGAPETQSAIEVIDRNARAQAQLIDDLLDMSRFVSGSIRVEMRHVDLAPIVATAVESVQPSADAKRIHLTQTLQTDHAMVFGDAARLQQVVWNLLSNALKFTPPEGRVDVRLERAGGRIDLTVSDTGSGIRPEFLPHIFDPFRQQDASTTRRHGGVGLGLSIVKQLVEIHGGDVRATSAGESQGSTFVVSLPVPHTWQAAPPEPAIQSRQRPAPLDGLRILVVDDEPDALTLMASVLDDAGAAVVGCSSAIQALDEHRDDPFDLVVCDIGMPDVDGYELLRRIRESGSTVPAIALTAYARPEDAIRAHEAGFQRHIAKPVDVPEFVAAVAELANRDS